jgi:hypothetical protein
MAQPLDRSPYISRKLEADQIIEMSERRRRALRYRDQAYEVYSDYYFGEQSGMGSPAVRAMNSQGRPLLRDLEQTGTAGTEYRSNHLMPVVDDATALLGRMPNSRVTAPDSSDAGIAKAEKETKYLISTHEMSNMDDQQEEVGWFLPCLGDAMYMLTVGTEKDDPSWRRVVWQTVDPRCAYPAFKLGHKRYDLLDVILYEDLDPYEARARFGSDVVNPRDVNGNVPLTMYISQYQRTVVVGDEGHRVVVHDAEWNLPFCPAVWVFNKKNGRFAQSDIGQSLIPQDAYDYLMSVFLDVAAFMTSPVPVVKEPTNVGTDGLPPWGPGMAPITLGEKGDFKFVTPQGDLSAIQLGLSGTTQEIYTSSGTSEVRQEGKMHSAIPTGRAAHALQGPQASRFELKQSRLAAAIRRLNSMTLEMQEVGPYLGNHTFDIFGYAYKPGSNGPKVKVAFAEKFTPEEDIAGWYRNEVRWDSVIGMNQQQKTAMAYEAKAAGIIDTERAIEIFGEEDPPGMAERVRREKEREIEMQAKMQGGGAPPGGPGGGSAPPPGGGGPPGGGPQMPPSPSKVARPYELGAQAGPLPSGIPQGVTLDAVKKALEPVGAELKGTVAVVGELAQRGKATRIEAVISVFKDWARVNSALQPLDPQAKVRALDESKWPDDAVRVI